jgi:hypothetical protein
MPTNGFKQRISMRLAPVAPARSGRGRGKYACIAHVCTYVRMTARCMYGHALHTALNGDSNRMRLHVRIARIVRIACTYARMHCTHVWYCIDARIARTHADAFISTHRARIVTHAARTRYARIARTCARIALTRFVSTQSHARAASHARTDRAHARTHQPRTTHARTL